MAQAYLNGRILDDGGLGCEARFQYGPTVAMGTYTPWQGGALVTGDTFSAFIVNMLPAQQCFFQAEARNAVGAALGAIISLMYASVELPPGWPYWPPGWPPSPPVPPWPPLPPGWPPLPPGWGPVPVPFIPPGTPGSGLNPEVASVIASAISEHDAQMNGVIINDHGFVCSTRFEYGGTAAYGSKTRWVEGAVTGSTFAEIVSLAAAGLDIHYRAVAQNRYGIGYGADIVFTTRQSGSGSELPGELIYPLLAEMEA